MNYCGESPFFPLGTHATSKFRRECNVYRIIHAIRPLWIFDGCDLNFKNTNEVTLDAFLLPRGMRRELFTTTRLALLKNRHVFRPIYERFATNKQTVVYFRSWNEVSRSRNATVNLKFFLEITINLRFYADTYKQINCCSFFRNAIL